MTDGEQSKRSVGRPRRSSREMLEDAAAELFLEQGYPGTSIEHITQRAGVSRNTFFNYFSAKADLLWVDLDATLAAIVPAIADASALAEADPALSPRVRALGDLRVALVAVARAHPASRVPWAFSQSELMGTRADLESSALARLTVPAAAIAAHLCTVGQLSAAQARTVTFAVLSAAAASFGEWVDAGVRRGPLEAIVDAGIAPVIAGFAEFSDGAHTAA